MAELPLVIQLPAAEKGGEEAVELRCTSWRTAGEANNLRRVRDCVLHVCAYLTGHSYRSDLDLVTQETSAYARAAATRDAAAADATQAAWVFDVDETPLSNLPYYAQHGYRLELFDHREFDRWVETGEAPTIPSSLRQYREVRDLRFKTFLLTGRRVVCSFLIECHVQIIARYAANKSMDGCAFCNADGDFLIVPQQWSSLPLESEEFSVTLVDPEKKDKERAEREYKITIRIAGRTDLYHLQQFLKGRQMDMPQETIQVLDVAGLYIIMDKPGGEGAPKHQMIDCYIHTLA
ncbi:hypothetical protein ZWY2020_001707 [Hordeum vulgare]|nr:hypothetical protein ZWY2020_001707 [Hordeum vulgare]